MWNTLLIQTPRFRTGDIGQISKENQTLRIIDRKKDLWKGPAGEYVALSMVECAVKLSPFVDMAMVYGKTGEAFVVVVCCGNEGAVRGFADKEGIKYYLGFEFACYKFVIVICES